MHMMQFHSLLTNTPQYNNTHAFGSLVKKSQSQSFPFSTACNAKKIQNSLWLHGVKALSVKSLPTLKSLAWRAARPSNDRIKAQWSLLQ